MMKQKRHDWFMITFELCISRCQCQKWWHMRTYITAWQCRNSEWIWIFRCLIMVKYLYLTVNIQWSALLFFSPVNLHHVDVMIAAVYFLGSIDTGLTQTVWAFRSIYSFFKECNDYSFCIYYTQLYVSTYGNVAFFSADVLFIFHPITVTFWFTVTDTWLNL